MRTIMITGVQGMDGSILMDYFLEKGDKVIGLDTWRPEGYRGALKKALDHENFQFISGDITEQGWITALIQTHKPNMFFNMGAISLVPESFKIPHRVMEVNTIGVLNVLEAIRYHSPKTKFYQASSSEQIGGNTDSNQSTDSRMIPNSPYAISKLASYHFTRLYRESYGIFAVNGMLFNHEGERRGPMFVTRKITQHVAMEHYKRQFDMVNIVSGERRETMPKEILYLGNLDAGRDWGWATDYCRAMVMMMEADEADDYAVATGETHTVREFVTAAFKTIGVDIVWEGEGLNEVGKDSEGNIRVAVKEEFYRPLDVPNLHGDPSKIKKKLGWEPTVTFDGLVKLMVNHDIEEML